MRRKLFPLFPIILLWLSTASQAQQLWTGIIAPTRAINWTNAGVVGGIPDANWAQCTTTACKVLTTGPASAITATKVNAAIASAPAKTYVYLPAGTYTFSDTFINITQQSNVVLRGAGANQTFIINTYTNASCNGGIASICVQGQNNWEGGPGGTANWTAGYAQGATSLTFSSAPPVGTYINLDQCDTGYSGTNCSTGTATDNGAYFVCQTNGVCGSEGGGGSSRNFRSQTQMVKVTAVSGSGPYTVSITPGLYDPNWASGQNPGAWWPTYQDSYVGIENLSIDDSVVSAAGGTTGILFYNCANCWATGTRTVKTGRNHIWLYQCAHCTIANNYMYGTQNATDESYGVETWISSDSLIVNNIGEHIVSPTLEGGPDEGDVVAYNFSDDDYYGTSSGWFMPGNWLHAEGTAWLLFEGNQSGGFEADNRHGDHNLVTGFRNFWAGYQASCYGAACTAQTMAINGAEFDRYFNYVGNVLGLASYHNTYNVYSASGNTPNGPEAVCGTNSQAPASSPIILAIGWSGSPCFYQPSTGVNDPYSGSSASAASMMLWGNYDVVNGAVRFVSSEVPSGLTDGFANPVPASNTLPASFYYSSQPSWWSTAYGTSPWPAIGPDVTGGTVWGIYGPNSTGWGGHANNIPAELVWANTPPDPYYQTSHTWTGSSVTGSGPYTVTLTGISPAFVEIPQGEIRISGASPSACNTPTTSTNGSEIGAQITAGTATSVSYQVTTSPGSRCSGGTVSYSNVRLFTATAYGSGDPPPPPTGLTTVVN